MSKVIQVMGTDLLDPTGPQAGQYYRSEQSKGLLRCHKTEEELVEMRQHNNPDHEPVGHHTGRCSYCGSKNLWSDNLAYGCDDCGAMMGGN